MDLLLLGTSHHLAPIALRERLLSRVGQVDGWLASIAAAAPRRTEVLVLATCHRFEVYVATPDMGQVEHLLNAITAGPDGEPLFDVTVPHDRRTGEAAVAHLCRVACGLESVIVGEAEISGQLRRAAAEARAGGTLGPFLERIVASALRASGRARAETTIGHGVVSAASAGVTLADAMLGGLRGKAVLVIGAGQAGRQALSRLSRLEASSLWIASRSRKHAAEVAATSGASPVPFEDARAILPDVDLLITALQAPASLIDASWFAGRTRPLVVIDLSVPRAVNPGVREVPGVTLRSVDDLGDVARASLARRVSEIPRVEAIAADEARRAFRLFRERATRRGRQAS